jgi:hypothetical protein
VPVTGVLGFYTVEDNSQNPGSYLLESVTDGAYDVFRNVRACYEQHPIDNGRQAKRIAHWHERRRVDDDLIKLVASAAQKLAHFARAQQFTRVGWNRTCCDDGDLTY